MTRAATPSSGICEKCGISWEKEPHDHRPIKITLSPDAALRHWKFRGQNNAAQSR